MKGIVKICILMAFLAHQYDAMTLECIYTIEDWVILDKVYGCTVGALKVKEGDDTVVSVSKNHIKGKTSKDVETLNIENATLHTIPKNIEKSFPNLKALRISKAQLRTVKSDDFKPFPALRVLCLWANELTTLDGNLLINNPNLEFINFGSNHLQHVGPKFFEPMPKLIAAYFEENACINNTRQFAIDDLKFEVAVKCPPSFGMIEYTLVNQGKLASKNDEIDNRIKLLESRIAGLEEQAKK